MAGQVAPHRQAVALRVLLLLGLLCLLHLLCAGCSQVLCLCADHAEHGLPFRTLLNPALCQPTYVQTGMMHSALHSDHAEHGLPLRALHSLVPSQKLAQCANLAVTALMCSAFVRCTC